MILWCAGMIRSGSTLQYNLAREMLLETRAGFHLHANESQAEVVRKVAKARNWFVTKGHLTKPDLIQDLLEWDVVRVCMTYRDLRDVVVSTMAFRNRTFEETISKLRQETVGYEQLWLERIPQEYLHRVRYEEMIVKPEMEVMALADLIRIKVPFPLAKIVAARHSIEQVKRRTVKQNNWDAHTRYGPRHIRSGKWGQWKTELKPKQIKQVEDVVGDWLVANGYELSE